LHSPLVLAYPSLLHEPSCATICLAASGVRDGSRRFVPRRTADADADRRRTTRPCWRRLFPRPVERPAKIGKCRVGTGPSLSSHSVLGRNLNCCARRLDGRGWVVTRHAELYAREYGWAENFEALCAQIVADFVSKYDPKCERCWIAEMDGQNVGSVFLVKDSNKVARLRLLLVDPAARGRGLGTRLTNECIQFAHHVAIKVLRSGRIRCSPRRVTSMSARVFG
jgi:GNAT superfamily N-acetyltransferase